MIYIFLAKDARARIVASIIFSKLTFPNDECVYILGPVAVAAEYQRQGIGQAIIRFGLDKLRDEGVEIAITYGDIKYYAKTGFIPISEEIIQEPLKLSSPEGWIAQSLKGEKIEPIKGKPTCLKAIDNPRYW